MTTNPYRPGRFFARFAIAGVLALGLAGGVASAAAAAPPAPPTETADAVPADDSLADEMIPVEPKEPVPPKPIPCNKGLKIYEKLGCKPPKCIVKGPNGLFFKPCPPKPCKVLKGHPLPDWCPVPCKTADDKKPATKDCPPPPPPPKKCDDPDTCDRPVPGKPTFTG